MTSVIAETMICSVCNQTASIKRRKKCKCGKMVCLDCRTNLDLSVRGCSVGYCKYKAFAECATCGDTICSVHFDKHFYFCENCESNTCHDCMWCDFGFCRGCGCIVGCGECGACLDGCEYNIEKSRSIAACINKKKEQEKDYLKRHCGYHNVPIPDEVLEQTFDMKNSNHGKSQSSLITRDVQSQVKLLFTEMVPAAPLEKLPFVCSTEGEVRVIPNLSNTRTKKIPQLKPLLLVSNTNKSITSNSYVRKSIPKPIKAQVWRNTYGKVLDAHCEICRQNTISAFRFHCGHIIAIKKGGTDTIDNLRAICEMCNLAMGTENMNDFKKRMITYGF